MKQTNRGDSKIMPIENEKIFGQIVDSLKLYDYSCDNIYGLVDNNDRIIFKFKALF